MTVTNFMVTVQNIDENHQQPRIKKKKTESQISI